MRIGFPAAFFGASLYLLSSVWADEAFVQPTTEHPLQVKVVILAMFELGADVTGMGTAHAAASVMALGLSPKFDFSHAY